MKEKIKILYVSTEISPYASVGGLGEVGRSFPKSLYETGNYEVRRVMPLYRSIQQELEYIMDYPVRLGEEFESCILKRFYENGEPPTYFIQNDRYYYREHIYGYDDDGVRFFFFSRAVVELIRRLPFDPDIVHINDWHTGFLACLLKREFPHIKTVFTIHNIAYQGFIPSSYFKGYLSQKELELLGYPEWLNFMKAGIVYADLLTTVSPGYAKELQRPEYSCGLLPLLKQRKSKLVGILNGIDYELYNPAREKELEFPYDSSNYKLKKKNKEALRKQYGLLKVEKPLYAMITRLDYAKGIELLIEALELLDLNEFQLFILGSGNSCYQNKLMELAIRYPSSIKVEYLYSMELAKRIYAAADIFLMPSLYEPCGLGQLYAMRYGAVPIVNPVGGLKDTVIDDEEHPEKSNGFYLKEWSKTALAQVMERAVHAYYQPAWKHYIENGMKQNFTWEESVRHYRKCYVKLLAAEKQS